MSMSILVLLLCTGLLHTTHPTVGQQSSVCSGRVLSSSSDGPPLPTGTLKTYYYPPTQEGPVTDPSLLDSGRVRVSPKPATGGGGGWHGGKGRQGTKG